MAETPPLMVGGDGEEPQKDVGLWRVTVVLHVRGSQAADDRTRAGEDEGGGVGEDRPRGRRVAPGGEGGGHAGEATLSEGAVDGPAEAVDDPEGGAVVHEGDDAAVLRGPRPHGEPAGIVKLGRP